MGKKGLMIQGGSFDKQAVYYNRNYSDFIVFFGLK
jgi:hypothetical protein